MPDFYLRGDEIDHSGVLRACEILSRVDRGNGDDSLIVRLAPSVPAATYHTTLDTDVVVLAARWEGFPLRDPSSWPIRVYVALPRQGRPEDLAVFKADDLTVQDWGFIWPSIEAAEAN